MLAMLTPLGLRVAARGSGPGYAAFDRLRALRSSELQGRDEEQGFSSPNKEHGARKAAAKSCPVTRQPPDGEAERKRHSGEPVASFTASRETIWPVSPFAP